MDSTACLPARGGYWYPAFRFAGLAEAKRSGVLFRARHGQLQAGGSQYSQQSLDGRVAAGGQSTVEAFARDACTLGDGGHALSRWTVS